MRRTLLICEATLAVVLASAAGPGCSPGAQPQGGVDAAVVADAAASADLARLRRDMARETAGIQGTLLEEDGRPSENNTISVCTPAGCLSTKTDPQGGFTLAGIVLGQFTAHSIDDFDAVPRRGVAARTVTAREAGVTLDLGKMYLPTMPPGMMIPETGDTPRTFAIGDGVEITAPPSKVDFLLGPRDRALAGRLLRPDRRPPFDLPGEAVIGVIVFMPWGTSSAMPIAVRAPVAASPGSEVRFRTISVVEGTLSAAISGHASKDGTFVETDPGTGLKELTWAVISQPVGP